MTTWTAKGRERCATSCQFADADDAVKELLGLKSRVPSKADFENLLDANICTREWDDARKGWIFTGKGDYSPNSIFLPAAGCDAGEGRGDAGNGGNYWSSTESNDCLANAG